MPSLIKKIIAESALFTWSCSDDDCDVDHGDHGDGDGNYGDSDDDDDNDDHDYHDD